MHKRRPVFAPRLVRGSTSQMLIAVVAVFFALAVAAYFLVYLPNKAAVEQINGTPTVGQAPAHATSVAAPTDVDRLSVDQLLSEARKAMNDRRLVAPAGNNAYEFYLKALERQPGNAVAADALRETFTFASSSAESAINQRDFNEAQREIDLLAKADPENYQACMYKMTYLAERWYGSPEAQLAFGRECLAQADFDTRIPLIVVTAHANLATPGPLTSEVP